MTTDVLVLGAWNVEYYQTMAATERARIQVAKSRTTAPLLVQVVLWYPIRRVTRETEKLVALLARVETYPSSVLLEGEGIAIPSRLHELFMKICNFVELSKSVGLHESIFLKESIFRISALCQEINAAADRFEDAQIKLQSRVSADEVQGYKEAYQAYSECQLKSEQATEEDVKKELLHF